MSSKILKQKNPNFLLDFYSKYNTITGMPSKVYFTDFKSTYSRNMLQKLEDLFNKASLHKLFNSNDLVACKLHFGERGNTNFIKPVFVKKITEIIKANEGIPFLTDTNSLYVGERSNAISHLNLANFHGFGFCPIVIADGLRGDDSIEVEVQGKHFRHVKIARGIYYTDTMIAISHFKGHFVTGFGGALKNLGMGCAAKAGKLEQHSSLSPRVGKKCNACGVCIKWCPAGALSISKVANIDESKCIGCGVCIGVCPVGAIKIRWDDSSVILQEKMVEHAIGAIKGKRVGYINFVTDVTPLCDCWPATDPPVVPDIGILASLDPVSIDRAAFDLVEEASGGTFSTLHPKAQPEVQLEYSEKLGLGTQKYKLVKI